MRIFGKFEIFSSKKWSKIGLETKNYMYDFCATTSLHGFRHITSKQMSINEKRVWVAILVAAVVLFIFFIQRVVQIMINESILIELESVNNNLDELDFPAVTICNHNQIYKPSAEEFMKKLNNSKYSENEIKQFFHYLPILMNPLANVPLNYTLYDRIFQDLNVPLKLLMRQLMHPCDQFIVMCEVTGVVVNCTDIFKPVKSYKGFCCAYNNHASSTIFDNVNGKNCTKFYKDSNLNFTCENERDCPGRKRVQKVSGSGIHTGVYFRIYLEPENYFGFIEDFEGASIIIHESHDYPEFDVHEVVVQQSKQVNVIVSGTKVESDISIHQLSQKNRNCVISSEMPYNYSFQTCISTCKMKRFSKVCACVPYYYPDVCNNISKTCDFKDMDCIRKNYVLINNIYEEIILEDGEFLEKCFCLHLCSKTKYVIYDEIATIYQGLRYPFLEKTFNSTQGSDFDFSKAYIYFQDYTFTKYKKRLSLPWYTTIGILGSILGLCLGGSFISLLEPFMHIFVTPCRIAHRNRRENKIANDANAKIFKKLPLRDCIKIRESLPINRNITMFENDFKVYLNYKKSNLIFLKEDK